MKQLLFDFDEPAYPDFDKFLGTANAELLHILQGKHAQFIYIWGAEGAGKSHILQAWAGQAAAQGRDAVYIEGGSHLLGGSVLQADCVAVDQVSALDSNEQAQLFSLFNRMRNSGSGSLLIADNVPPQALSIREDLRTRMAYCLVYEVKSLSDEEKIAALQGMAAARQLDIDPKIFRYLLDYWQRDMDSLITMFNDLADYSKLMRKPVTLPLLRQLLKQQSDIAQDGAH